MFAWFGFDMTIAERLQAIKDAGFEATGLGWDEDAGNIHEQPDMARKIGLQIDHIHASFRKYDSNQLWIDNLEGEDYQNLLINGIEDCKIHNVPVMVAHLSRSKNIINVTEIGLQRIAKIVETAERKNVKVAFENIVFHEHLNNVFEYFTSTHVGLCYDSGHENAYSNYGNNSDYDLLELFKDRVFALHIHDNYGEHDSHLLPFDGTIDWNKKMQAIKLCTNVNYFTLEVGYEGNLSAKDFLNSAYETAIKLLSSP